ncbi:MAG: heparan-alpha-glucosaminide N-acetyltransferase [Eubacteriales bacterium]|nr:heparan-alpha-glucosaminide N-acetyltransferase [Eubacteriales bacterium]
MKNRKPHQISNSIQTARLPFLDVIRGITLISMILYHGMWDLVYLKGVSVPWYGERAGYLWQQSICWTFIFLSGFCTVFAKRLLRRGLTVSCAGFLVTLVTLAVLYEDRVVFGVLTLIGSCMLLIIPVRKWMSRCRFPAFVVLLLCSFLLFVLTKDINVGRIGTSMLHRVWSGFPDLYVSLPESLYCNLATAYFGFPPSSFFSTDYFSLLPWFFLYVSGYSTGMIAQACGRLTADLFMFDIRPLSWIGRHSLLLYMLHQPVLYLVIVYLMR